MHSTRTFTTRLDIRDLTRATRRGSAICSDQAHFLKFRLDDILVERLHDIFVGAGVERTRDVRDIILRGAENYFRLVSTGESTQRPQKFITVHFRHVPIQQDRVGNPRAAGLDRFLTVFRFRDLKLESFEDSPCDLADHAGVVHDQTRLHGVLALPLPGEPPCQLSRLIAQLVRYAAASPRTSRTRSASSTTRSCSASR